MGRKNGRVRTTACPACKGADGSSGGGCQYCGGDRLVSRRVARVIKQIMGIKSPKGRDYPLQIVDGMRRLDAERDRLAQIQVPAAFTGEVPDTPEAAAARRQLAQVRGKDDGSVQIGGR